MPRYVQLADALAAQIAEGTFGVGDKIPSLRRLAETNGVSVTTSVEACELLQARGLVVARPRSGFIVRGPAKPPVAPPARSAPSMRRRRVDTPLSLRMNLGIGNPQHPTLGAAVQGPELMAITPINRLMSQALRLQPTVCHSYDAPPGSPQLRRAIAQHSLDAGYVSTADDIVITSGAKEAVYLSIRAVTHPGDTVVVESPG